MLTDKELRIVQDLIFIAEEFNEECDHEANICFCGVTSSIIEGYAVLHSNGLGEHHWIIDYDITDGTLKPLLRCDKCFAEKPG